MEKMNEKNNNLKQVVKRMDERIDKLDEFIENLQLQLTLAGELHGK